MASWIAVVASIVRVLRHQGIRGVRVTIWAVRACRRVRRQLSQGGLDTVRIPAPPVGGDRDLVLRALRRANGNCLERALVLQRFYASQRSRRTVVIGVTAPSSGFHAHAWLDGETDAYREGMVEILRRPTPTAWLAEDGSPLVVE